MRLDERDWNGVVEAGLNFRFPLSGRLRWAALGYHFAGRRLWLRNSGRPEPSGLRYVIEIGAGAW